MAFTLGNFNIDEIIRAAAESFAGNLLYTLDQLNSASIEITSDSTEVTDKRGNTIRTIYKTKKGTFNATSALMNPAIMNNASGSSIQKATATAPINMPKFLLIGAGSAAVALDTGVDASTIKVMAIFGSGANGENLTKITTGTPSYDEATSTYTYLYDSTENKITIPAGGTNLPTQYFVMYTRSASAGYKMENTADKYPDTCRLTLYCSYVDPCDDSLRACYVVLPSFTASPETTINLNADEQEMSFNGTLNVDYCATSPVLYYIYFPDEDAVKTAIYETT